MLKLHLISGGFLLILVTLYMGIWQPDSQTHPEPINSTSRSIIQDELLDAANKGKFPHGIKPGTPRHKVLKKMQPSEVYLDKGSELIYTFNFDEKGFEFGDLTFFFERGLVTSAQIETYFVRESGRKEAGIRYYTNAFNKLYGSCDHRAGACFWTTTKGGIEMEIILTDISSAADEGYVIQYHTRSGS